MADLTTWTGIGAEVLNKYLQRESGESGSSDAGSFGLDIFINGFEDEFPADPDEAGVAYPTYSPEASRASEQKPWGQAFGERPKVHELNQPFAAQELGWRVVDLYPNRDKKWDFNRVAGTPSEIRLLLQIIQIIRKGNTVDFEKWFEAWENGFPEFSENRSTGNYRLAPSVSTSEPNSLVWERIRDRDKRPRYKEWTTSVQRANLNLRVIEYFPTGFDGKSMVLSGPDIDLIRHIIQIEYEGGGTSGGQISQNPIDIPRVVGKPLIKLYFYSLNDKKIGQGEVSFRLMQETDASLTKTELKQYAQKIVDTFGKPAPYSWSKGTVTVSYNGRDQGVKGYFYSKAKFDGIDLIKKILAVTGQEINLAKCRVSECQDPAAAYPQTPSETMILGEIRKSPVYRPIVDVNFVSADLFLASLPQPIRLVDRSNRILI